MNVRVSPSSAEESAIVTSGAMLLSGGSSSKIVPVPVSVAVTDSEVPETFRLTVNVSSGASLSLSSVISTRIVCVSPSVPAKVSAAVFSL